jgi:hypothetical protein
VQECKFFGKGLIYLRDQSIRDGGSVYWQRDIKPIDVEPIIEAIKKMT